MTMYAQLPFFLRRMLALQAVLLFFMFTFSEVKLLEQRRKAAFFVPLLITGSYLFFQWDILTNPEVPCYYLVAAGDVPAAVPCGLLALLSLAGLFFCRDVMNWKRTHITPMSVKESVDTLPAGLCCSFDDGFPKLVNRRMEEICRSVTGEPLRDAEDFYRVLTGQEACGAERIRTGPEPVLRLRDGNVYSFQRGTIFLDGIRLRELLAVDVTEEYRIREELREKRVRADAVRTRLRNLNRTITAMTVERETLEAKTRIHDAWGRLLLTARRWYADPGSVDWKVLSAEWRRVSEIMKNEGPNAMRTEYVDALRDAWHMGVEVTAEGLLPETSPAKELLILAVNTCVTNTLRHAEGRKVFLSCRIEDGCWIAELRNDGRRPEKEIREGGGLGNLRRRTEDAGGSMEILSVPEFVLKLRIPAFAVGTEAAPEKDIREESREEDTGLGKRTHCG